MKRLEELGPLEERTGIPWPWKCLIASGAFTVVPFLRSPHEYPGFVVLANSVAVGLAGIVLFGRGVDWPARISALLVGFWAGQLLVVGLFFLYLSHVWS